MQNGNPDGVEEEDNPRHSTAFDHTSESSKHLLQVVINSLKQKGKSDSIQHLQKNRLTMKLFRRYISLQIEKVIVYFTRSGTTNCKMCKTFTEQTLLQFDYFG